MVRACLWIIILILMPIAVMAADTSDDPNPFVTAVQSTVSSTEITNALIAMEAKIADDINANNDENFRVFDGMIKGYIEKFTADATTKAIIGILGLNALVAGAIFYFMNKQNRKMSYDSYMLRTKQSEDDRKYIADSINALRNKLEYVEQEASKKFDLSVIPMDILDAEVKRRYDESYAQYAAEQQQFDQKLNEFAEQQQYGGVQNEWTGRGAEYGEAGYAQASYDAVAGEYASQATPASAATAPVWGGTQAQGRFSKARYV